MTRRPDAEVHRTRRPLRGWTPALTLRSALGFPRNGVRRGLWEGSRWIPRRPTGRSPIEPSPGEGYRREECDGTTARGRAPGETRLARPADARELHGVTRARPL